jgi:hypothetical protein
MPLRRSARSSSDTRPRPWTFGRRDPANMRCSAGGALAQHGSNIGWRLDYAPRHPDAGYVAGAAPCYDVGTSDHTHMATFIDSDRLI